MVIFTLNWRIGYSYSFDRFFLSFIKYHLKILFLIFNSHYYLIWNNLKLIEEFNLAFRFAAKINTDNK